MDISIVKIKALQARLRSKIAKKKQKESKEIRSPFVPTPDYVIRNFLEELHVTNKDVVLDIGCGDGRVVLAAAFMGAKAYGIEADAKLYNRACIAASSIADNIYGGDKTLDTKDASLLAVNLVQLALPVSKMNENHEFRFASIFKSERFCIEFRNSRLETEDNLLLLEKCSIVFLYMLPEVYYFLLPILLRYLTSGSRIVCYMFLLQNNPIKLSDWNEKYPNYSSLKFPDKTIELIQPNLEIKGKYNSDCLYVYDITKEMKI